MSGFGGLKKIGFNISTFFLKIIAGLSGPIKFGNCGESLGNILFSFAYLAIFYIVLRLFVISLILILKKSLLIFLISFFLRFTVLK